MPVEKSRVKHGIQLIQRIPRPWLWALAGAALVGVFVFVFVVAPSLLIRHPHNGLNAADELKARNDVRATLVQALAGLAVAGGLVVTYRTYRQNRAEQDRTYERELYAKAVEQLGHEKAPVRLGALYSLEHLAQDRPDRRQVIVNVICSYLRMPFSLMAPEEPNGKLSNLTETEARRIIESGNTWQQERQVRVTAQRILAELLHDNRTKDQRFVPGIRLDLAGATLIEFDLQDCVMGDANFHRATFSGEATFSRATFSGDAVFGRATFSDKAWFVSATFSARAMFGDATFSDRAEFGEANFSGVAGAEFGRTIFRGDARFGLAIIGDAWFSEATIIGDAWFSEATFNGHTEFGGATFNGHTEFGRATFNGYAGFGAIFKGKAGFGGATFNGDAWFTEAAFGGVTLFDRAMFKGKADFGRATFSGGKGSLSFERSHVLSSDAQRAWPMGWQLRPDGSGGYTVVRANDDASQPTPVDGSGGASQS